jgi:probable F420-dependent oxidoreductase
MHPGPRAFRFGVGPGSIRATTAAGWKDFARHVEDLGYAVLSVGDHVIMMGPIAAIATAAAVTTTLRVGSMTFGNDYRHPLVLAQEVATLDVLSGGRMEFALGAGWDAADYVQMGVPMDPPATRISRLGEAIAIFNRFFTGEEFSFAGEHYTITGATGRPVPLQRPRPPLVIGGGGKRLLSLAAREADVVAINATLRSADMTTDRRNSATLADTQAKVGVVRDAAGDRQLTGT